MQRLSHLIKEAWIIKLWLFDHTGTTGAGIRSGGTIRQSLAVGNCQRALAQSRIIIALNKVPCPQAPGAFFVLLVFFQELGRGCAKRRFAGVTMGKWLVISLRCIVVACAICVQLGGTVIQQTNPRPWDIIPPASARSNTYPKLCRLGG